MGHGMMDGLLNTFLHSAVWHAGGKIGAMFFIPIAIIFIGYGIYKFTKKA